MARPRCGCPGPRVGWVEPLRNPSPIISPQTPSYDGPRGDGFRDGSTILPGAAARASLAAFTAIQFGFADPPPGKAEIGLLGALEIAARIPLSERVGWVEPLRTHHPSSLPKRHLMTAREAMGFATAQPSYRVPLRGLRWQLSRRFNSVSPARRPGRRRSGCSGRWRSRRGFH